MAGLFFSSGEGIQLLPFPATPAQTEKNSAPRPDEKYKVYSFSVHNSAIHKSAVKTKIQKKFNHPDCSGTIYCHLFPVKLIYSPDPKIYFAPKFFSTSIFPASSSNRAPPAI